MTNTPLPLVRREWVVFDTNAIRSLGTLDTETWSDFRTAWVRAGFRTAWAPPSVVEIAGTNLAWKDGLDADGLREVQRAVARFDELALREIELDVDELVRRSFYDLADVAVPPLQNPRYTQAWREVLDGLLAARSPTEIVVTRDGGSLRVRVVPPGAEEGWEVVVPPGFTEFVRSRIASRAARLEHRAPGIPLKHHVASDLEMWGYTLGDRFGVPREVVRAALDPSRKERLWRSPFAMRAVCEIAYDVDRMPGGRSVEANDQIDLALTTYLFDNRTCVTGDRRLAALLLKVCADPRRIVVTPLDLIAGVRYP